MAKDLHADGIVDVALQFCTLYEMESFAVEKAAEEAGIPFMHITTDYAGEDAGQLQTRIEAFLGLSVSAASPGTRSCRFNRRLRTKVRGVPLSRQPRAPGKAVSLVG